MIDKSSRGVHSYVVAAIETTVRPSSVGAMSAAAIIRRLAASPAVGGCVAEQAVCAVCGNAAAKTMPFGRWQGANFTDQNKINRPDSDRVCADCVWVHSWVAPPGCPPDPAKPKGKSLRMFSHLWDGNGYLYLPPKSGREISDWLRQPRAGRWFAAIALSGQKHVLPYTPVNSAGGRMVRFEEETMSLGDWRLLDAIEEILATFRREHIDQGLYPPAIIAKHGAIDAVRDFERAWSSLRGSSWWRLCIFLARKKGDSK